jgi:putative ABC transport system substrate-binding protein
MRIKRRALVFGAAAWPLAALAQQAKKVFRIGYLSGGPGIGASDEAFRQRLRELGYVEGKNLVIEWRFSQGRGGERAPGFAAELVRLKVDCIAANGVAHTRAAKQATTSIPIVMLTVDADPVEMGFVASLARPGGNVTGFTGIAYHLAGKRLELLRELVPHARRVGMLVAGPAGDAANAHYRGTEEAARKLGLEIRLFAPPSPEEFEGLIARSSADWRPEMLSVFTGAWFNTHRTRVLDWVVGMKLPAVYSNQLWVPPGGLMSYAPDITYQFAEAATYVAKILGGAKPADLPVQQPTKFQLAINLKTAKALGLAFPQTIMLRADRIIE